MAPKGVSNWRRPYTSIYNNNYKYGTGLYSDTLSDIEKRYTDSLSKTKLRSDRPDLAFDTFSGSNLASSPTPGSKEGSCPPGRELQRSASTFESRLNTALHSSYALDEEVQQAINARMEQRKQRAMAKEEADALPLTRNVSRQESGSGRPKSLYDDAAFWTLPKAKESLIEDPDVDVVKTKRKVGIHTTSNGPSGGQWREKSRVLQDQVDSLESSMSSCGSKLQSELSSLKSKYHSEVNDLNSSVEMTSQQASELQKLCKRQANQLLELQSAYDDSQRNIQDSLEEVSLWQNKCRSLKKEMDRLREEVEQATVKTRRDRD